MKRTLINLIVGLIIFYIGTEVGYQIAFESIDCIKVTPNKKTVII